MVRRASIEPLPRVDVTMAKEPLNDAEGPEGAIDSETLRPAETLVQRDRSDPSGLPQGGGMTTGSVLDINGRPLDVESGEYEERDLLVVDGRVADDGADAPDGVRVIDSAAISDMRSLLRSVVTL